MDNNYPQVVFARRFPYITPSHPTNSKIVRNPRTKQLFSDDVRFSNKSNNLLIGKNAREYKPQLTEGKEKKAQQKTARHVAPFKAKTSKSKLSIG